eukprot:sb/3478360/
MVVVPSGYEVGKLAKKHFFASLCVRHNLVSARFVREATPLTDRGNVLDDKRPLDCGPIRVSGATALVRVGTFSQARSKGSKPWPGGSKRQLMPNGTLEMAV